jgi:hypothetical protein
MSVAPIQTAPLSARRSSAVSASGGKRSRQRNPAGFPPIETAREKGNAMATEQKKKWSADVTEHSDALDLEKHVFEQHDPKKIAESLKRSAEHSHRRKGEPFQSAMSMLTFYINRAGKNLPDKQRKVLEDAKDELRAAFGRERQG